jgi:hypothetical protein
MREMSVLYIRSRLYAIQRSNLEFDTSVSILGFTACFLLLPNSCTKEGRAHRGWGAVPRNWDNNTRLDATPLSFKKRSLLKIPRRNYTKSPVTLGFIQPGMCVIHKIASEFPARNCNRKQYQYFLITLIAVSVNFLRKLWNLSWFNDTVQIAAYLALRNNCIQQDCK